MRMMNRGNAGMNEAALDLLEVSEGERVLDLGFGGGVTFRPLIERGAIVTGVDRAEDVIVAAERAHRDAIAAKQLEVAVGEVQALPFPDGSFDAAVTVNTVYFWPELGAGLRELWRVLAPGGRLVVATRSGAAMKKVSREIFTVRAPEDIRAAIEAAGFAEVRLESPGQKAYHLLKAARP